MNLFVNIVGKRGMICTKKKSTINNSMLERSFYMDVYLWISTKYGDE